MPHDVISFGAVWTAWYKGFHHSFVRGEHEVDHLRVHPEEFQYHFGRSQAELVEQIPAQITWMNDDPASWCFEPDHLVIPSELLPKVLEGWQAFCAQLLFPAVHDGRITYGVCGPRSGHRDYYAYAQWLAAQGRHVVNYLRPEGPSRATSQ